jgi:CRP-like cAMP-binding protein
MDLPSQSEQGILTSNCPAASSNSILAGLPELSSSVLDQLETVSLHAGDVLFDPDKEIPYVYFPTAALVSVVCLGSDGTAIEVGLIGHEGMVGLPAILGGITPYQAVVQISGQACRISVPEMSRLFHSDEVLRDLVLNYVNAFVVMTAQYSICNCYHSLQERVSRWLLVASDRVRSDSLAMTHDMIARLLGTRRASVTVTVGLLERAGLVKRRRGMLQIGDREGLEQTACECYGTLKAAFDAVRSS